jgi:hypothetical protein
MRFRHVFSLIEIKKMAVCGCIMPTGPGRSAPATSKSSIMQKFALKLLLTSLIVRRKSKRIDGAQLATSLLTLALLFSIGLYAWLHGQY